MRVLDIHAELDDLVPLHQRGPQTTEAQADAAFANLGSFANGAVFAGSFDGDSPWERHPGDELVQVIRGQTKLTILTEDQEHEFDLLAGQAIVVPSGCWHRFSSPGVSLLTITPQPTEHSDATDPRSP